MLDVLILALVLVGLCLVGYYPASEAWDAYRRQQVAEAVEERVSETETSELDEVFVQARAYNAYLSGGTDEEIAEEELWEYSDQLSVPKGHDIAFGYVVIPSIALTIPIYHGTSDAALAAGAGHLEGTSLPVGGASTHAVITGHTGMSGMRAFDDISELEPGDIVGVKVLGQLICYEVTSSEVVLPEDVWSCVGIEVGEDLLTLMTCTPYGVNTHRLLVHAARCDVPDDFDGSATSALESTASSAERILPFAVLALVAGSVGLGVWTRGRRRDGGARCGRRRGLDGDTGRGRTRQRARDAGPRRGKGNDADLVGRREKRHE